MATNKLAQMAGLFATPRECLRGHGPMEMTPGDWSVSQVQAVQGAFVGTGTFFLCKLYRCNVCGSIELVDEEGRRGGS